MTCVKKKEKPSWLLLITTVGTYITADELQEVSDTSSIIFKLAVLFCLLGVPNSLVSDNGPQFVSEKFQSFLAKWDFRHVTSSPKYLQ